MEGSEGTGRILEIERWRNCMRCSHFCLGQHCAMATWFCGFLVVGGGEGERVK